MRAGSVARKLSSTPPIIRSASGCLGLFAVTLLARLSVTSTATLLVPLLAVSVLWPLVSQFRVDGSPLSSFAPLFVSTGYALGTDLADLQPSPLPPVPNQYYVVIVAIAAVLSISVYAANHVLRSADTPGT